MSKSVGANKQLGALYLERNKLPDLPISPSAVRFVSAPPPVEGCLRIGAESCKRKMQER